MEQEFSFAVIHPERIVYEGKVVSLVIPCANGSLGILAHHARLCGCSRPGEILIREHNGSSRKLAVSENGFLEVRDNVATLLLG